ncbi:GRIP and coiled-coil domain-containing protein 1 [Taenia crassiceps]|uniref:GRIP and coiled-coil domain-containing protein 1 n=1 Tax=Taenia crassiceps TaxID=6207 RepID=A0ABR4QT36_9CEST
MEQQLQEQANRILRYETKLRDIISAYQKLQADNESLEGRLRLAESNVSQLHHELEEKNQSIDKQHAINADLRERVANLTLEEDGYRKEKEKNSYLKQKISQLLKDLEVEQNNSKTLKDALLETQEQHEASTRHFETRISDIVSTLKTYQEIHQNDTETINQLRSDKRTSQNNAVSQPTVNKVILADLISALADSKGIDAEVPDVDDLFDFMRQLWRVIIKISPLQQPAVEKQLLQYLDLKSLASTESLDVCEKEKSDMQQELETLKLRLMSFQAGARKVTPVLSSDNNRSKEMRNLETKLQEAQDHIKLLRDQNLTTLLELESLKKSVQSKISVVEEEAANRLAKASARQADQLMRLESEARRYREQTLNLLTEKEEEISELRNTLFFANHETTTSLSCPRKTVGSLNSPPVGTSGEEPDSTESILLSFNEPLALHCGLVHCAERHERLMIELKKLRNSKRELEQRVEALEARVQEDQKAASEATAMKQTIFSSPTLMSGDVDLAYVKNIIFNLLSSFNTSSFSSKMAVVRALSMALHFSPEEENAIIGGTIG